MEQKYDVETLKENNFIEGHEQPHEVENYAEYINEKIAAIHDYLENWYCK